MSEKRILIIDDDSSFLEICSAILMEYGYKVDTATNTKEGLEKLMTNRPDLLILDVMLISSDKAAQHDCTLLGNRRAAGSRRLAFLTPRSALM